MTVEKGTIFSCCDSNQLNYVWSRFDLLTHCRCCPFAILKLSRWLLNRHGNSFLVNEMKWAGSVVWCNDGLCLMTPMNWMIYVLGGESWTPQLVIPLRRIFVLLYEDIVFSSAILTVTLSA